MPLEGRAGEPLCSCTQVSLPEHSLCAGGDGERVALCAGPSVEPRDPGSGVVSAAQAQGPLLAPRVPVWGESHRPGRRHSP